MVTHRAIVSACSDLGSDMYQLSSFCVPAFFANQASTPCLSRRAYLPMLSVSCYGPYFPWLFAFAPFQVPSLPFASQKSLLALLASSDLL